MRLGVGIDTGGTYTDAVLMDLDAGTVLGEAKALTTHQHLDEGIEGALSQVLPPTDSSIQLVSISTTLATNALVEGRGAPVCLLLLGYQRAERQGNVTPQQFGADYCVFLPGGHDIDGQEAMPLDEDATRRAILQHAANVRAFAVSGYYGTRNPAHERAVREMVACLTGLPTTAGHELSQQLDAMGRATTAALNARLIPLICDLIDAVQMSLERLDIHAPLMVVKGDGSLISAETARQRPIETILSGPAASIIGARFLAGTRDAVVADMGGTTTDIAWLRQGRPALCAEGARVARWRTMVEAIDIQTVGLGGDSEVRMEDDRRLVIGPRRILPVCLMAERFPQIVSALEELLLDPQAAPEEATLYALQQRPRGLSVAEPLQQLLERLAKGPLTRRQVEQMLHYPGLYQPTLQRLENQGIIARVGVTPTDAAHVTGQFVQWPAAAAVAAIQILGRHAGLSPLAMAQWILRRTSERIAQEIVRKAWATEASPGNGTVSDLPEALLDKMLEPPNGALLQVRPSLARRVIGLGAPAHTYFPAAASLLNTDADLPPHAHVANAVGAVMGTVVARARCTVQPDADGLGYVVYSSAGTVPLADMEEALRLARSAAEEQARSAALRAGADGIQVQIDQRDSTAPVGNGEGVVFISTEVTAEAIGRPRLAAPAERQGATGHALQPARRVRA
ncbi:MAG: hydantoinase/oxoprolinase family protein [Anaerolineae bacterium]|jgi:N-methylhydantoinase A/oxoprolinase/acetone carboxylase beta subunit|nr:hydantoinase/oxoprolinase family protein [Chloroflexota bacterium]